MQETEGKADWKLIGRFLFGPSDYLLRLEPVIQFRAGLTASPAVELMRPAADALFEREGFDRGFLCAWGCRPGATAQFPESFGDGGKVRGRAVDLDILHHYILYFHR